MLVNQTNPVGVQLFSYVKVLGSFISHYLHKVNKERKV